MECIVGQGKHFGDLRLEFCHPLAVVVVPEPSGVGINGVMPVTVRGVQGRLPASGLGADVPQKILAIVWLA